MLVNQIAQLTGVSADTVRYYSKINLLKPSQNPDNGYHEYAAQDVSRLRFILAAKEILFGLVGSYLYGWYVALLWVPLHSFFSKRIEAVE